MSMARLMRDGMRETRERIAAMSPAQRAAMGLPEDGWESAYRDDLD